MGTTLTTTTGTVSTNGTPVTSSSSSGIPSVDPVSGQPIGDALVGEESRGIECLKCGQRWHTDMANKWGKTRESLGQGPVPMCTNLIPIEGAPRARTADPDVWEQPRQICGGQLFPVAYPEKTKVRRVTTL